MTRSIAKEFHASTNFKFRKQGRDVKFHGTLGKIQLECDFFISKTTQDAAENFLLAAGESYGAFCGMACLKELFGSFMQSSHQFGSSLNHYDIIARSLAAHHAVHGQQAGGVIHRETAIGTCRDLKMGRARILLVENE